MGIRFNSLHDAQVAYAEDAPRLASRFGIVNPFAVSYLPEHFKHDWKAAVMAMDAATQAALTTAGNSAIPSFFLQYVDPATYEILFAANKAAEIYGEEKMGNWTTRTALFPLVEHTGEVSTYGDYNENGSSGANANWPQRQAYLFQTFKEYGELELDNAGEAKLNWASEVDKAAMLALNKFHNLSYVFGISGLQNYGGANDPNLPASLTPAPKAWGGTKWINNGVVVATANEIFADIQSLYLQGVKQTVGLVDKDTPATLALAPDVDIAMTTTNAFNVNVVELLKKNFPNLTVKTIVQYGAVTAANPQGIAAGNLVQLIFGSVEGQKTMSAAFSEKMRAHRIIQAASSWRQKITSGTWGTVNRQPFAVASMLGV